MGGYGCIHSNLSQVLRWHADDVRGAGSVLHIAYNVSCGIVKHHHCSASSFKVLAPSQGWTSSTVFCRRSSSLVASKYHRLATIRLITRLVETLKNFRGNSVRATAGKPTQEVPSRQYTFKLTIKLTCTQKCLAYVNKMQQPAEASSTSHEFAVSLLGLPDVLPRLSMPSFLRPADLPCKSWPGQRTAKHEPARGKPKTDQLVQRTLTVVH